MKTARRVLLLLAAAAGCALIWTFWLPDTRPLKRSPPRTTAYIELRRRQAKKAGKALDLRWHWVPYDSISENLKQAVVTAEDDTFWRHDGVDMDAVRAAFQRNWKERKLGYGGSTITQQVARNLYLSPSKNPLRKIKEALIARRLERELGKRRILELYLNIAEWGKGIFGCEAAARAYFAKSCAELTPDESVAMAVVLPNPRRWTPDKRGPYVERNSRRIVGRMRESGLWRDEVEAAPDDEIPVEGPPVPEDGSAFDQSASTSVNSSTGSVENDQGKNPIIEE